MHQGSSLPQRTLKASIHCAGVGLHSGSRVHMTLHPGEINDGIVFVRTDRPAGTRIVPALWDGVRVSALCTVVGNEHGTTVSTVEHLMAALRGCGIDNAVIELDGPEVPIMDGSAAPFVFLVECAGIAQQAAARRAIRVLRRVEVRDGGRIASLSPGTGSSFSFEIDFPSAAVARQEGYIRLSRGSFENDLARARTFGFLAEVEGLRARGLALGGSLDNAIVIDGDAVLNPDGLRFEDEFVRHKLLDSIGDLYLAGAPIVGHFHGHKSGHALNHRLLEALFADDGAWCFDTARDPDQPHAGWIAGGLAQTA
jgi:UDP-3-O-[3-hydroxymyristoyl] N-acetylglucosamine deacetylase